MRENVHTFQQPLFTWTIGPHAHLAGIPHSPVAARVLFSYHILTISVISEQSHGNMRSFSQLVR